MVQLAIYTNPQDPYTYLTESVSLTAFPLPNTDVIAEEYLNYAMKDLEAGTSHGSINALGNAKRALHLTVDSLLNAYGLLTRNRRASFPMKLKLLDAAGLFSLSILNTLNLERNAMEHEYRVPTHARASEVVDVARLLLLATHRISDYVSYECIVGWRADGSHGVLQLNPAVGNLAFFNVTGGRLIILEDEDPDVDGLTILAPIRGVRAELMPGIDMEDQPLWSIHLTADAISEWSPLLKPVIEQTYSRYGIGFAGLAISRDGVEMGQRWVAPPPAEPGLIDAVLKKFGGRPVHDYSSFTFGFSSYAAPATKESES
jgi:hypothetical protein